MTRNNIDRKEFHEQYTLLQQAVYTFQPSLENREQLENIQKSKNISDEDILILDFNDNGSVDYKDFLLPQTNYIRHKKLVQNIYNAFYFSHPSLFSTDVKAIIYKTSYNQPNSELAKNLFQYAQNEIQDPKDKIEHLADVRDLVTEADYYTYTRSLIAIQEIAMDTNIDYKTRELAISRLRSNGSNPHDIEWSSFGIFLSQEAAFHFLKDANIPFDIRYRYSRGQHIRNLQDPKVLEILKQNIQESLASDSYIDPSHEANNRHISSVTYTQMSWYILHATNRVAEIDPEFAKQAYITLAQNPSVWPAIRMQSIDLLLAKTDFNSSEDLYLSLFEEKNSKPKYVSQNEKFSDIWNAQVKTHSKKSAEKLFEQGLVNNPKVNKVILKESKRVDFLDSIDENFGRDAANKYLERILKERTFYRGPSGISHAKFIEIWLEYDRSVAEPVIIDWAEDALSNNYFHYSSFSTLRAIGETLSPIAPELSQQYLDLADIKQKEYFEERDYFDD